MNRDHGHGTLEQIISDARALRAQREADWRDYETLKRRIRDCCDQAMRSLVEALDL